jgi:hypothetical protein
MACIAENHGLLDSQMRGAEELLLLSYKDWPVTFLDPKLMASAGLYFTQYTDLVCCRSVTSYWAGGGLVMIRLKGIHG